MRFNNNFIGYPPTEISNFIGGDSEELYLKNLNTQPEDWYYRHNKITYEYNSNGHRCREIEDIDLDNYILFAGCSHVEGIGLELEKTFAYRVAETLGVDYYNLALGGSGVDVMTYNLMTWLHTTKKLPKFLVILWPQSARYMTLHDGYMSLQVPANHMNDDNSRFIVLGEKIGFFDTVNKLSNKLITTGYNETTILHLQYFHFQDYARDLSHAGNESNQIIADKILSYFE